MSSDLYPVGPYSADVTNDLSTEWTAATSPGITDSLRTELQRIVARGWKIGVYDLHTGPKRASSDVHAKGDAADIDYINGELVGGQADQNTLGLARDVLSDPGTRIGAGGTLYATLAASGVPTSRLFPDSPTHLHVDVEGPGAQAVIGTPTKSQVNNPFSSWWQQMLLGIGVGAVNPGAGQVIEQVAGSMPGAPQFPSLDVGEYVKRAGLILLGLVLVLGALFWIGASEIAGAIGGGSDSSGEPTGQPDRAAARRHAIERTAVAAL